MDVSVIKPTVSAQGHRCYPQPSALNPQPSGFTLVEVLLASTMIAVMFVGLGAHLRGGMTVWRRATTTAERLQRRSVAFTRFSRDLANALVYDSRAESYGAAEGQVPQPQFGEARLAWFTVGAAGPSRGPDVRFVTYVCGQHEGSPGLWRTSQLIGEARLHREARREQLMPDCDTMAVRYAYLPADATAPIEWHTEWRDPETTLPRVVEVSVRLISGEVITRRFAVPAGALKPFTAPAA